MLIKIGHFLSIENLYLLKTKTKNVALFSSRTNITDMSLHLSEGELYVFKNHNRHSSIVKADRDKYIQMMVNFSSEQQKLEKTDKS